MAFTKKVENNKVYFDLAGYEAVVKYARVVTETMAVFTLACHGFALYGMKLVQKADGTYFIAPPANKGKDGKYYNIYAIYLTKEDERRLIEKVLELIGDE